MRPPTSDEQIAGDARARARERRTDRPGVYRMISTDGEIVYVGKSKRVRSRLLSYFRCEYPEDKGARICATPTRIEWEYMPSEFAALLEELRLIKRFRPRFNVAMKRDGRNYCFIKITQRPGAQAASSCAVPGTTTRRSTTDRSWARSASSEAVRELNDVLGLRDCPLDQRMHFADQPELFHDLPANAGLHPLRGQEVSRPVRRRMHGAAVRRPARAGARISRRRRRRADGARFAREMEAASERLRVRARRVAARQAQAARGAARAVRAASASPSRRCRSSTPCPGTRATIAST